MGTRATLEVNASDSDYPLTISGYVLSIAQPNVIHIAAGGADAGNIVATGFRTPFAPVTLGMPAARQLVTLTSEHAGAPQPHDPRPLAAALGNPVVLTRTGARCRITGG